MFTFIVCMGVSALCGWVLTKMLGKLGIWIFINLALIAIGLASESMAMVGIALLSQLIWIIALCCHTEDSVIVKKEIKKQNDRQRDYEREFGIIEYKNK